VRQDQRSDFIETFDLSCQQHEEVILAVDTSTGDMVHFGELPGITANLIREIASAIPIRSGRILLGIRSQFVFSIVYLSMLRHGLTAVPVNPLLPGEIVRGIKETADADGIITDGTRPGWDLPMAVITRVDPRTNGKIPLIHRSPAKDAPAIVLFTSGTTSSPKGVAISSTSLLANAADVASALSIHRSRLLGILPLHHTNGQVMNILIPLLTGSTIYCGGSYGLTSLTWFWKAIAEYQIEYVDLVPTMVMALLSLPSRVKPRTPTLKHVICGAAPVSPDTLRRFEEEFDVRVLQEYGLSEATCISAIETPAAKRWGTVGKPLPGNRIEIRDESGQALPDGHRGEIWIKGSYNMQGYLGGAGGYGLPVSDGWIGTGDLGQFDKDGFLTICGRKKNVIIKGGETIIPEDIEKTAQSHGAVVDAAAIGRQDRLYGEVIDLLVVWRDGHRRAAELEVALRKALPKTWWPDRLITVAHIPRTSSGKIIRNQLTRLIAE